MPRRKTNLIFSVLAVVAVMIMCADVQAQLRPLRGRLNAGQSVRPQVFRSFGSRVGRQSSTPVYGQPVYGQPVYAQPTYGQPTYAQPTIAQPNYYERSVVEPAYVQPMISPSTYVQPTYIPSDFAPSYQQPMMTQFYGQPAYDPTIAQPLAPGMVEPAYFPAYANEDAPMMSPPMLAEPLIQADSQIVEDVTAPVQPIPPAPASYEQTQTIEANPPIAEPPAIAKPMIGETAPTAEFRIIDEITAPVQETTDAAKSAADKPIDLIEEPATKSAEGTTTESKTDAPVDDPFDNDGN
jgi:hypothetical protein